MKPNPLPDSTFLHECFTYNPITGLLYWKERPLHHFKSEGLCNKWNRQFANKQTFTSTDGEGYAYGGATQNGKRTFYKAHRIAWKMVYGIDPVQIDHDNRIRTDNRLSNLVESSAELNAKNRGKRKDNLTGYTGVFKTANGKYGSRLGKVYIGTFNTALEAHNEREAAKAKSNYHVNHGY